MEDPIPKESLQSEHLELKEVLRIQIEKLWRLGELGFSTNFSDVEEVMANHSPEMDFNEGSNNLNLENESDVAAAMRSIHNALCQLQQGERLIKDNKFIISEVEAAINEVLLSLGKSKRWIGAQNLRIKILKIIEIKTPQSVPNFVTVFVVDPLADSSKDMNQALKQVNLPHNATLYQIHELLRQVMKGESLIRCNDTGEDPQLWDRAKIVWKYQLMAKDRSKLLNQNSIELETDSDLKGMYRTLGNAAQGSKPPDAVLTCVSLVS